MQSAMAMATTRTPPPPLFAQEPAQAATQKLASKEEQIMHKATHVC